MPPETEPADRAPAELKIGDRVRFRMVNHDVEAVIIGDYGPIGDRGRRILRLRGNVLGETEDEFDMPAEECRAA